MKIYEICLMLEYSNVVIYLTRDLSRNIFSPSSMVCQDNVISCLRDWDCVVQIGSCSKNVILLIEYVNCGMAQEETLSFKHVLAAIPTRHRLSAPIEDISPHLCFICLLHLANEHGLSIHGCADLNDLRIHLPPENHGLQSAVR